MANITKTWLPCNGIGHWVVTDEEGNKVHCDDGELSEIVAEMRKGKI